MHHIALVSYDRKGCIRPAKRRDRLVVRPVEGVIFDVQRQGRFGFVTADSWLKSLSLCSKKVKEADLVPKQSSYLTIDRTHFWATCIAIETGTLCKADERSDVDCMRPRDFCTTLRDLAYVRQVH